MVDYLETNSGEQCPVVRFSRDPGTVRIDALKALDTMPDKCGECTQNFGPFYMICIAFSIITYVLDLVLTCMLLYLYFDSQKMVYFFVTLIFVLVPAILMSAISLRWYIVDHDDPSIKRTSLFAWIIRILFLLLHIAPLLRYLDTLFYGIRSNIAKTTGSDQKQLTLTRRMLDEDTNGALLRLFHCFLHSAPQAVIQLMILVRHMPTDEKLNALGIEVAIVQAWTVLAALVSIGWSLTSYHRSVRFARDDKEKISWPGTMIAFCWHFMSAVARVVALSLLAAVYPVWFGCVCGVHWAVMAGWLALGQHGSPSTSSSGPSTSTSSAGGATVVVTSGGGGSSGTCGSTRCEELLLSAALGLAYVLAFLVPRDGPTRYVYLAYYLVCLMENTAALVVWCVANNSHENPVLYYGAAGCQIAAFLLGIIFLYIYYTFCHPSTHRKKFTLEAAAEISKPGYSKTTSVRRSYS